MATSPSTSSRFTLVPPDLLTKQPPTSELDLPSLLEASERLADEAKEALPYSFDECTWSKGYLRQGVWGCVDCGEKGVCYGCSISCHSEHKLVELWTKRHFRCDCPTDKDPSSSRRPCSLNPPANQPQLPNDENKYSKNFKGEFCRCGREYDAETEEEAMINCIACEDWLHESCLNLRPSTSVTKKQVNGDDEDEDEEIDVLIPSESYDGLICAGCVRSSDLMRDKAGSEGWMIVEPQEGGTWEVIGRRSAEHTASALNGWMDEKENETKEEGASATAGTTSNVTNEDRKRPTSEDHDAEAKRPRLDNENDLRTNGHASTSWKGKGDIFLAHGVREHLKTTLAPDVVASLPFPLEDEDTYEPPTDEDKEETLDEVTNRVVESLPRVQAIEALHGYQNMKDKLKTMLQGHVENRQAVTKTDIESFFEGLRATARRSTEI